METIKTVKDLNDMAREMKEAGEEKELLDLAKEYGIDEEDAKDFMDGIVEEFASPIMAAVGKLKREAKELEAVGAIKDWEECIEQMCMDNMEFCDAVIPKEKTLLECMEKVLKFSFENKVRVNDEIAKAAGIRTPLYLGYPNRTQLKQLITEYYMG